MSMYFNLKGSAEVWGCSPQTKGFHLTAQVLPFESVLGLRAGSSSYTPEVQG